MADSDITRLQARVSADYEGYNYVPTFPGDLSSAAIIFAESANVAEAAITQKEAAENTLIVVSAEQMAADTSAAVAAAVPAILTNRTVGAEANDSPFWAMTRSTPQWAFGPAGTLEETAVDNVCWEFDATTRAPRGMAFAGSRTNSVTNPRGEGGTPGSPGIRPSGWGAVPSAAPTIEFVAMTTRNGVPGVIYRFSGTPSSTVDQVWNLSAAVAITSGQSVALSVFCELIAGSMTNVSPVSLRAADTGAGAVSFTPGAFARITNTAVVTNTSSVFTLRWNYLETVTPVDFTIFVGGAQQEINVPFVSGVVLPPVSTPAASTRAQGNVSLPVSLFGSRYMHRQGTIIVEWSSASGGFTSANDLDFFGVVSLGDTGANDVMGLLINPGHNSVVFRRIVGGVGQSSANVSITPPVANTLIKSAFSWNVDQGLVQVATQGVLGTQLTGQFIIPPVTHLMPGRFSTNRPLFGNISGFEIRPFGTFGAALTALTV